MKIGKVSDSILKRSVLKYANLKDALLQKERHLLQKNQAGVGEDCGIFSPDPTHSVLTATASGTYVTKHQVKYAIHRAVNNIAASGGQAEHLLFHIMMPPQLREQKLKNIMQEARDLSVEMGIQIAGGHTEVTDAVTRPCVTVTALGTRKNDRDAFMNRAVAGDDIIMTKWGGIAGTLQLVEQYREKLSERFSGAFMSSIERFSSDLSCVREAEICMEMGVSGMHDVAEGGIFGALWEMAERSHKGLYVELKKIPMKQETIEICNLLDRNPYELMSQGSLLITSKDGYHIVEKLAKEGIHAVIIGKITEGNDRLILNEDEKRFLEPARNEELFRELNSAE